MNGRKVKKNGYMTGKAVQKKKEQIVRRKK